MRMDCSCLTDSRAMKRANPTRRIWCTAYRSLISGRGEVQSFLLSSAMFWITQFHADGLRVSSVQPMLYLNYQREAGEWKANQFGENWNTDGARFCARCVIP